MPWELFLTYVLQNVLHNVCIQQNFLECLDCNNHHTINYNISCRPPRVGLRSGKNMVVVRCWARLSCRYLNLWKPNKFFKAPKKGKVLACSPTYWQVGRTLHICCVCVDCGAGPGLGRHVITHWALGLWDGIIQLLQGILKHFVSLRHNNNNVPLCQHLFNVVTY